MGILNIQLSQAGLVGTIPTPIYINTNDTYAVVTTTGYLNEAHQLGEAFSDNQMALVETSDYGPVWLKVVVSGADYSLSQGISPVGQYIEAEVLAGAPTSLVSGVSLDITSISVPAGEWDVFGSFGLSTAATTSVTLSTGWASTTSVSFGTDFNSISRPIAVTAGVVPGELAQTHPLPTLRFSLSATTTIYLSTSATFTVDTTSAYGKISASRVG